MEFRANLAWLALIFQSVVWYPMGKLIFQESDQFVEDGCECNEELVKNIRPYISGITMTLLVARIPLIILSNWYPKITRCYFAY